MEGLDALEKQLAALGKEVATRVASDALRASAQLLAQRWRAAAPFDPERDPERQYKHLREEIRIASVVPRNPSAVVWSTSTGNAFWGNFYEFGTFRQPPRPWARPVIEASKTDFLRLQAEVARAGIERAAAGNAAKGTAAPVTGGE